MSPEPDSPVPGPLRPGDFVPGQVREDTPPKPDQPGPKTAEIETLRARESRLRANLQKLLAAVAVFIASVALLLSVPFFPPALCIVGAAGLAALAFKAPPLAIAVMLFASLVGYIYQLGIPALPIVMMALFYVILSAVSDSPGAATGAAAGVVAAMLTLTPFFFLALPVIMGVTIFRARGQKVGSTSSLLLFLLLYLPLLTANLSISSHESVVPLFQQVSYQTKEPVSLVEVGTMVSALVKEVGANKVILPNLTVYLPIGYTEYGSRLLGVILAAIIAVSISIAFGLISVSRWMARREIRIPYLPLAAPVVSLVIASLAFVLLLGALEPSFAYSTALDSAAVAGLLLGSVVVGGLGSATELWLSRRDQLIKLKEQLFEIVPSLMGKNNALKDRLEATRVRCAKLGLSSEQSLTAKCSQELSFATAIEHMDLATLQRKLKLLKDLEFQIDNAFQETLRKLTQYYTEGRLRYNDYLRQSNGFGFPSGDPISEAGTSAAATRWSPGDFGVPAGDATLEAPATEATSFGYEGILKDQENLNEKLGQMAHILMKECDAIVQVVVAEIDSTMMTGAVEIARNYLNQGQYEDAVDTLLTVMTAMERNIQAPTASLSQRIDAAGAGLKAILSDALLPKLDVMGDEQGIKHLSDIVSRLGDLRQTEANEKTFARLFRIVSQGKGLAELNLSVVSWLAAKISELEKDIEARVPRGHSWGKESYGLSETEELIAKLDGRSGKQNLENRMATIENTNKAVESKALLVDQYASTLEFLINFINIEYLLDRILQEKGRAEDKDLPVRPTFALRYLKLYYEKRYGDVMLDAVTNVLSIRRENER